MITVFLFFKNTDKLFELITENGKVPGYYANIKKKITAPSKPETKNRGCKIVHKSRESFIRPSRKYKTSLKT